MAKVGTPSVKGVGNAIMDYGIGFGTGLLYNLARDMIGTGIVGGVVSAGLAGAFLKGSAGDVLPTILGFQSVVAGLPTAAAADNGGGDREVI